VGPASAAPPIDNEETPTIYHKRKDDADDDKEEEEDNDAPGKSRADMMASLQRQIRQSEAKIKHLQTQLDNLEQEADEEV
jgi:molecular chaperone GrpE (heat shock protein)